MTQPLPPLVELFSKPDCHLCDDVKALLRSLQSVHPFTLREINIAEQTELLAQYGEEIPVVFINGRKAFKYRVEPRKFVRRLRRAQPGTAKRLWQHLCVKKSL